MHRSNLIYHCVLTDFPAQTKISKAYRYIWWFYFLDVIVRLQRITKTFEKGNVYVTSERNINEIFKEAKQMVLDAFFSK